MTIDRLSRRSLLAATGLFAAWHMGGSRVLAVMVEEISQLKPGQYTWHPDRSPEGPVAIIVSIPDQRVYVYRNGIRIAVSTCSTGKPGHDTPTGVFTILQKDKNHHSSTYNDAPMPNMNRLTWSGIALHAGQLPGYPASHGCVRLPLEFSRLLFTVTHVGTPVIIANNHSDPVQIVHPGPVLDPLASAKMNQAVAALSPKARPAQTHHENKVPPLAILVSSVDRKMVLFENGHVVAEGGAQIKEPGKPLGHHVYVLSRAADGHTFWHGIGHHDTLASEGSDLLTLQRIGGDDQIIAAVTQRLHVGAILTTVDRPLTAESRSGRDFLVMTDLEG